jgi:cell division protein FtsZ
VHAEYAKRPATQRPVAPLDPHGRAQPRAEDDQLEIPAFLRRQSN